MITRDNTVYHVQLGNLHKYFGSIAAIYEVFTPRELGVKAWTLYAFGITERKPYTNGNCVIRKSVIHRKRKHKA